MQKRTSLPDSLLVFKDERSAAYTERRREERRSERMPVKISFIPERALRREKRAGVRLLLCVGHCLRKKSNMLTPPP